MTRAGLPIQTPSVPEVYATCCTELEVREDAGRPLCSSATELRNLPSECSLFREQLSPTGALQHGKDRRGGERFLAALMSKPPCPSFPFLLAFCYSSSQRPQSGSNPVCSVLCQTQPAYVRFSEVDHGSQLVPYCSSPLGTEVNNCSYCNSTSGPQSRFGAPLF